MVSASRGQHPQGPDELEAPLGRSLAETERLNRPGHRAGEQARAAVRRQNALAGRGVRHRRAFGIAILLLLALAGLVGWLVRMSAG
jgi:hypothetical protein